MIGGVILAAGKGTRFKSENGNKTAAEFLGKPLVVYGVDLLEKCCDEIIVVIGQNSESVKEAVGQRKKVKFVEQSELTGTGTAVRVAIEAWGDNIPDSIVVGYGDHMMFYHQKNIEELVSKVGDSTVITLVSTIHDSPSELKWGRIVRNEINLIERIVEQKDATEEEQKIEELNAGLYAFVGEFLAKEIFNISNSPVTGEYYLTDLIGMALNSGSKVDAVILPFEQVGFGINTKEELYSAEQMWNKVNKSE